MNVLFAEIDANGWAIIIGALVMGAVQIITAWRTDRKINQTEQKIDHNTRITQEAVNLTEKKVDSKLKQNLEETKEQTAHKVAAVTKSIIAESKEETKALADTVTKALNGNQEIREATIAAAEYAKGKLDGINDTFAVKQAEQIKKNTDHIQELFRIAKETGERIDRHAKANDEHQRVISAALEKLLASKNLSR